MTPVKFQIVHIIIFLNLFLLDPISVFSQREEYGRIQDSLEIKMGDQFTTNADELIEIFGNDNDYFYCAQKEGSVYSIVKFSKEFLKPITKYELNFPSKGDHFRYVHACIRNGVLNIFTYNADRSHKKNTLYCIRLNAETFKVIGVLTKIKEIEYSRKRGIDISQIQVKHSRDSSKVLIYYNNNADRNIEESFGVIVLNDSLNELWANEYQPEYDPRLLRTEDISIGNLGDVYILRKLSEKRNDAYLNNKVYKILLSVYSKGKNWNNLIEQKGFYPFSEKILIGNEDDVYVCGYFRTEEGSEVIGCFIMSFNKSVDQILYKKFVEFNQENIVNHSNTKTANTFKERLSEGQKIGISQLLLDHLKMNKNGDFIFIGERRISYSSMSYQGAEGPLVGSTTYSNWGIVVTYLKSNGDILWNTIIRKNQGGTSPLYSGYDYFIHDDDYLFIFNNSPENIQLSKSEVLEVYDEKKPSLTLAFVNHNGELTRKTIIKEGNKTTLLVPTKVTHYDQDGTVLFLGKEKNNKRFLELSVVN